MNALRFVSPSLSTSLAKLWLIILLLLSLGCETQTSEKPVEKAPPGKPLPEVEVELPRTQKVTEYEYFNGYLAAKEMIEIRARVSGYLGEMKFKEGTEVKKGDLLFEIDDRIYKANAANAAAMVNEAKARRDGLTSQYKRADDLLKRNAISTQEAEILQFQLAEAEAAVTAAEAKKDLADLDMSYTKIEAKIDGVIGNRRIDPGNLVKADETILGTIILQDPIYAYFDVNERTVLKLRRLIQQGRIASAMESKLKVSASLTDEEDFSHEGEIDFMDNQLDPATGTLRIRAVLENDDRLFSPGLFVRLRFPVSAEHEALMVREEALGSDQGERFLYVVDSEDIVRYRRVKVGVLQDGEREIREGIAATDRVIVNGLQRVKPKDKVIVKPYKKENVTGSEAAPATEITKPEETKPSETKPAIHSEPMPPKS